MYNRYIEELLSSAPTTAVVHGLLNLVREPYQRYSYKAPLDFGFDDVDRYLRSQRFNHAAYITAAMSDASTIARVVVATRNPQVLRSACFNAHTSWATLMALCRDTNSGIRDAAQRAVVWRTGDIPNLNNTSLGEIMAGIIDGELPIDAILDLAANGPLPRAVTGALLRHGNLPEAVQNAIAASTDRAGLVQLSHMSGLTPSAAQMIFSRTRTEFKRTRMVNELTSAVMLSLPEVRAVLSQRKGHGLHLEIASADVDMTDDERRNLLTDGLSYAQLTLEQIVRPVWTVEMLDQIDTSYVNLRYGRPSLMNPARSRHHVIDATTATSAVFALRNPNLTDADRERIIDLHGENIAQRWIARPELYTPGHQRIVEYMLQFAETSLSESQHQFVLTTVFSDDTVPITLAENISLRFFGAWHGRGGHSILARCIAARFGDDVQAWVMVAQFAGNWACSIGKLLDTVDSLR